MSPNAARAPDGSDSSATVDESLSLPDALRALAHTHHYALDGDDVNAALGLSFIMTAVPDEDDLARWPMYVRDAFLTPAARLFGMTIRDVHPPEAARGLSSLPEFRQHFDASYRPLVERALENDQPVLAWQGWPGDQEMMWGIITSACEGGIGLAGRVPSVKREAPCDTGPDEGAPGTSDRTCCANDTVILDRPPVQLYVVEAITPTHPDPDELLELTLFHAGQVLDNAPGERFGALTGPAAYDVLVDRLRGVDWADVSAGGAINACQSLVRSTLTLARSGVRFLERQRARRPVLEDNRLAVLASFCQETVRCMVECIDSTVGAEETNGVAAHMIDALVRAGQVAARAHHGLHAG